MPDKPQPEQNNPKGSPGLSNPKALSSSLLCKSPAPSKTQRVKPSRPRLIAKAITRPCLKIAVFLVLIALSSIAQEPPAAARPEEKKAEGTSTCFFYRYRLSRGSLEKIGVYIDGVRAVNLVNGRWVSIQVPAGHHEIRTKDKASGADVDMVAGSSYYFRTGWGEPGMFHPAHQLITLVMKEQAVYEMEQLKPLDEKDVSWPSGSQPMAEK